ncbi:MAG: SH3 domain-containing protein [Gammaproteobacteria bacterium]|nr:SH3 domain-containing protein [Gammaproteobacteria bacterium]
MRLLIFFFVCALSLIGTARAEENTVRVQVTDPYIELRTGPGRGFPVFYTADRSEWIEILMRKTDWYKVRLDIGKEGWVNRAQLENTLTEAGARITFRDLMLTDYLHRRLEAGFAWGRFEQEPVLVMRLGYRLTPNFFAELSASQVTATFSSTSLIQANLLASPYPDRRISPFFTLGAGRYRQTPRATLVNAPEISVTAANAGLGVRVYLTRNFLVRADFREYMAPVNDNRVDSFREWTIGLGIFF